MLSSPIRLGFHRKSDSRSSPARAHPDQVNTLTLADPAWLLHIEAFVSQATA
jgi:hypothetical protein